MVLGCSRLVEFLVNIVAPWNRLATIVLLPSAADQLPIPFRALAQSPQLTVFLAGGGYLVFLVLFLPLYAISFILTAAGAWAVLVGVVYAGGRGLTQTISYPGQSKQIQRELETEYTKVVSARLTSFANGLRLWLELVRDVTVVPSDMHHFRTLQQDVRNRSVKGDVWIITRALEELTAQANVPMDEAGAALMAGGSVAAVAAAAAGANALAPEAKAEAEALLECLSELLPILGEALEMTTKLAECKTTPAFDGLRQSLLLPDTGGDNRFASTVGVLETRTKKLVRLAAQLRSCRKRSAAATTSNNTSNSTTNPSNTNNRNPGGGGGGAAGGGVSVDGVGVSIADAEDMMMDDDEDDEEDSTDGGGGGGEAKVSGLPGNLVKSWWKARSPYEGAAGFALMRQEMLIKSNAQQIWLTMSDGTLLDCCYARAYGSLSGSGRGGILDGGVREDQGSARSSTGCVLFCNPNAGFWESTVMSGEGSRNWVSFYTSVGCDVFLFNYRGYGRSGGTASPKAINNDAKEVVEYLREELGVTRLAVHGESIGGVAAASVARQCQVDLLVLDRTFSSLSAIAQRMLGGWTKWAIWGFTGWTANVTSDYLESRCYKVLACDPEDAVIADTASAKSGLAVTIELGDLSAALDVYEPPKEYKVADHTQSCPPVERVILPIWPQERLSSLQIAHFAACLRFFARKAPRIGQSSPNPSVRRRRRRSSVSQDAEHEGAAREVEMVSMLEDGNRTASEAIGTDDENDGVGGGNPLIEGKIDATRPLGEVWILLSRVDGLCGRMLGKAVARGFDDVRTWVCCLVVLGPIVRADAIAASSSHADATGSLPVESAGDRLQNLIKAHPEELGDDPFISYTADMLKYLGQRLNSPPPPPAIRLVEGGHDIRLGVSGREGRGGGPSPTGGMGGSVGARSGRAAVHDSSSGGTLEEGRGFELDEGDRHDLLGAGPSSLGRLLPLRCGHNNPYSDGERRMLLEHLALEGWVAPDRRPLEDVASPSASSRRGPAGFGRE